MKIKIKRLLELSEDEEKAFEVISKIEEPMGSDCLIDLVSNAYKGANT